MGPAKNAAAFFQEYFEISVTKSLPFVSWLLFFKAWAIQCNHYTIQVIIISICYQCVRQTRKKICKESMLVDAWIILISVKLPVLLCWQNICDGFKKTNSNMIDVSWLYDNIIYKLIIYIYIWPVTNNAPKKRIEIWRK